MILVKARRLQNLSQSCTGHYGEWPCKHSLDNSVHSAPPLFFLVSGSITVTLLVMEIPDEAFGLEIRWLCQVIWSVFIALKMI